MSNARNLADLISGTYSVPIAAGTVGATELASTLNLTAKTLLVPPGIQPPSGTVVPFAGTSAPTGWLFCFGQAVSRTTYADLFTALGTTFGVGDGSTTFTLPDLRGRIPGGKDDMGGSAASRLTTGGSGVNGTTLGASGGAETHTLSSAQMPSHSHTVAATTNRENASGGSGTVAVVGGVSTMTSNTEGSGSSHNNTQPTIVLNYIIKT